MPSAIERAWRARLSRESVLIAELHRDEREHLTPLLRWIEEHLDVNRAARVRLLQRADVWQAMLQRALAASDGAPFDAFLLRLALDLDELAGLAGSTAIAEELALWRSHLTELQRWRREGPLLVHVEDLSCDTGRFAELGVEASGSSYFDLDKFSLYLVIRKGAGATGERLGILREGDEQELLWAPWTPLHLTLFEQDGQIDTLAPEEEQDDEQIGVATLHQGERGFPQGTVSLSTQGVCTAELTAARPLPEWVERLLSEEPERSTRPPNVAEEGTNTPQEQREEEDSP